MENCVNFNAKMNSLLSTYLSGQLNQYLHAVDYETLQWQSDALNIPNEIHRVTPRMFLQTFCRIEGDLPYIYFSNTCDGAMLIVS